MINERAAEQSCVGIKKSEGYTCRGGCYDSSCDSNLAAQILRENFMKGATTFICKNNGTERNTMC